MIRCSILYRRYTRWGNFGTVPQGRSVKVYGSAHAVFKTDKETDMSDAAWSHSTALTQEVLLESIGELC